MNAIRPLFSLAPVAAVVTFLASGRGEVGDVDFMKKLDAAIPTLR